mmetsp:Transcript_61495/g.84536  ORF Transcript_61495/g.84536 Transcript_61495/m.84536 type:complete len:135 (-) Transcript_61495:210-614(-)
MSGRLSESSYTSSLSDASGSEAESGARSMRRSVAERVRRRKRPSRSGTSRRRRRKSLSQPEPLSGSNISAKTMGAVRWLISLPIKVVFWSLSGIRHGSVVTVRRSVGLVGHLIGGGGEREQLRGRRKVHSNFAN